MEVFGKLGINWQVLIFQIINFCILLWILNRLVYKPLLTILEDRRKKVADSLKKAEETTRASQEVREKLEDELKEAREKAGHIVARAEKQAQETTKNAQEKSAQQAQEIVAQAKKAADAEKESVIADLKNEIADLVVDASQTVLGKEVSSSQSDVTDALSLKKQKS